MVHKAQIKPLNVQKNFDSISNVYEHNATLQHDVAIELVSRINVSPQDIIVDIGCGDGKIAKLLQIPNNIIQIDVSYCMCKLAHAISPNVLNLDMHNIALKDNIVDIVTSSFTLHWSTNIQIALEEIMRTMKHSAHAYIAIPICGTLKEFEQVSQKLNNCIIKFPHIDIVLRCIQNIFPQYQYEIKTYTTEFPNLMGILRHINRTGRYKSHTSPTRKELSEWNAQYHELFSSKHNTVISTWKIAFLHLRK